MLPKIDVYSIVQGYKLRGRFDIIEACFWRMVKSDGDCMIWTGHHSNAGYGQFAVSEWSSPTATSRIGGRIKGRRQVIAHRWAYTVRKGRIPEGMYLDHLCRRRNCVNPDHLEPVTMRENLARSPLAPAERNSQKTHCPKGHPYSGDNLFLFAGRRRCRACDNARCLRYYRSRKQ